MTNPFGVGAPIPRGRDTAGMSRVSAGTAFSRCAALSLLILTTGLAACGDSKDAGESGSTPNTPPESVAQSQPMNPKLDEKIEKLAAALAAKGQKASAPSPATDTSGSLRVGPFSVIVYASASDAKKAKAQFEKVFAKGDADPLLERHGNKLVVSRAGIEPTAAERKQFDTIDAIVAES